MKTKGMQVSLDQAKAFCYVVEYGGYSKAAEKLFKSHSALVYLIKSLEEQCGFQLFDRKGYRNVMTPAGQRIHSKCLELLSKVDELGLICNQLKKGWEPAIKIVHDGIIPFYPFVDLYKKFRTEKIPTVVQTYTDYLEDVETSFWNLKADIMISILPIRKPGLKAVYLRPFRSYLVAHKDHPINKRATRWNTLELTEFDFLTIRSSGQRLGLNTQELEESASFFLSDFSVKKEAILNKIGFGWLPHHIIDKELKSKILLPIKWERESIQPIQPILYVHNQKSFGAATKLIIDLLRP